MYSLSMIVKIEGKFGCIVKQQQTNTETFYVARNDRV